MANFRSAHAEGLKNLIEDASSPGVFRENTHHEVSASVPDWSREHKAWYNWDPSRSLLASIRSYQRAKASRSLFGSVVRRIAVIRHRFWSAVTGADIPLSATIGGGLLMPHPNGIVLHPNSVVGPNCLIFQQVTIGSSTRGIPTIGGHVDIGAGAKIIGPVKVGNHSRIGAMALVVRDVPEGATVIAPVGEILRADPN